MTDTTLPGAADAPEVTAPEAASPAEGANSTDATALATPPAETPPATGEPSAPPAESEPEHRKRASERIAELVSDRNHWRDVALKAARPAEAKAPAEPAAPKGPPRLEDFEYDTAAWAQAHNEWSESEIDRRAAAAVERKLGEKQRISEAETLKQNWFSSVAEFEKTHPDFRAVVFTDEYPVTETMTEVIARSEAPAALAYHLGQNRQEAVRISRLSPPLQAAALGRIEATLTQAPKPAAPAAKVIPRAPAPMSPIAAASPSSKKLEDMPIDEYMANRPWAQRR